MASQLILLVLASTLTIFFINGHVIGINLGTTYSSVGIMQDGKVNIIPNHYGNRITPSIISFTDKQILIGDQVGDEIITNSENTVYEVTRMLGSKHERGDYFESFPFHVIQNGLNSKPVINVKYKNISISYNAERLLSMILTHLKQTAETYVAQTILDAVITVPVHFDDEQRRATKDAVSMAGLNVLEIFDEAIAAASAYKLDSREAERSWIIIYDLGGTTLDVTLLLVNNGIFKVWSYSGNDRLGGKNFNENVLEYFINIFNRKNKIDISKNEKAKSILNREIEKAKCALSFVEQIRIEIEGFVDGIDFSEILTRAVFEELNDELFKSTLKSIHTVLNKAGITKDDIDKIVLSGGSTKIPKIQQLIKAFFNEKQLLYKDINPSSVNVYGAVMHAAKYEDPCYLVSDIITTHCVECVLLNAQNVDININNNYASITYSFEFNNTDKCRSGEIEYELSIDSGAYISQFVGEIDGKIYKGITKEKKKAVDEYETAKQDKKNAILVSQNHDANTFKI